MLRIGHGYDLHRLKGGHTLILGGVEIKYALGCVGHSDADVLIHSIIDALLGALALSDIGNWFPDTDEKHKDADSMQLLKSVIESECFTDWLLINLDSTIICEAPKLAKHILSMRENIASCLASSVSRISVKAKTNERVGPLGNSEAIAVHTVLILEKKV
ncbi:MAG: 2-C-methyl-D-erythritol 2,4-cyclodiphosphate synthase [Verrucomicrobiota bacterium]|nr:2-C-methyl-D-erythritol 2,4-cyclodiphosphate synthase [Verrucomicrobiota bacterium]